MKTEEIKKSHWDDAAKAGGILGLAYLIVVIIGWLTRLDLSSNAWIMAGLTYLTIAVCEFYFARKRAGLFGGRGFTYGQSMGFIMSMMLFAGFLTGVITLLMHKVVAPEYYREILDVAIDKQLGTLQDSDPENFEHAVSIMEKMYHNPIMITVSSIFSMLLAGGLIGLLVSIFVKREGDPFFDENSAE